MVCMMVVMMYDVMTMIMSMLVMVAMTISMSMLTVMMMMAMSRILLVHDRYHIACGDCNGILIYVFTLFLTDIWRL